MSVTEKQKQKHNISNVKKYRIKPVEIEAVQWDGNNIDTIREFVGSKGFCHITNDNSLVIPTMIGDYHVKLGEYIIKSDAGEFLQCDPSIFEDTYEEI